MSGSPAPRDRRDGWWAAAAALMMIPSLALASAPVGTSQVICLALVAVGMALALAAG